MDLKNIKKFNENELKKIWIVIDKSLLSQEIKPEFECILQKKGKIFTNSYTFLLYDNYMLTNKVFFLLNSHLYLI